jgi:hypothetical protein
MTRIVGDETPGQDWRTLNLATGAPPEQPKGHEIDMEADKTELEAQLHATLNRARDRGRPVDFRPESADSEQGGRKTEAGGRQKETDAQQMPI